MQIISATEEYTESFEGRRHRQRTPEDIEQDNQQARRIAERWEERKRLDCLVTDLCKEGKWKQATDVENIYSGEREADARAFHAELELDRRNRNPSAFEDSLLAEVEPFTPAKFARLCGVPKENAATITRALGKWWKKPHKGRWSLDREEAKSFLHWYDANRHKKRHPKRPK